MRRSLYLTGWLLVAFGLCCLAAALAFAGEGPEEVARSPAALALWGVVMLLWGGARLARAYDDGTRSLLRCLRVLQPLAGRPEAEVLKWLGAPQARCATDGGDEHLTWDSPGYSVTLGFRDGVCEGVIREAVRSD
jgi:hypothetical protein